MALLTLGSLPLVARSREWCIPLHKQHVHPLHPTCTHLHMFLPSCYLVEAVDNVAAEGVPLVDA